MSSLALTHAGGAETGALGAEEVEEGRSARGGEGSVFLLEATGEQRATIGGLNVSHVGLFLPSIQHSTPPA